MEIERKFLVKEMPDLDNLKPIGYERYYLSEDESSIVRIQKKGDKYEREIKKSISNLEHEKVKECISEEEFDELKLGRDADGIIREGYQLSSNPDISLKIYRGRFEGLVRVEVEFSSREDAEAFVPLAWMGTEITTSPLGADARLSHLNKEEFLNLLANFGV